MLKYMPKIIDKGLKRIKKFSRKALILISIIILAVIVGGYLIFWPKAAAYQAIAVERGSITETVSVTGNTLPINSVSLAFGNSGIVSEVHASVGDMVYKGQTLAKLDTAGWRRRSDKRRLTCHLSSQRIKTPTRMSNK
jgi:multidrug efflux pump subunit AcrA (membrane-fusion protein)